jgi:hypothetical protein
MKNIKTQELIQTIKKRPQMFVGSETVAELNGLLTGYIYARSTLLYIDDGERDILKNFSSWLINEKLDIVKGSGISWPSVLLLYYTSEKKAFDKFFELWDEFENSDLK